MPSVKASSMKTMKAMKIQQTMKAMKDSKVSNKAMKDTKVAIQKIQDKKGGKASKPAPKLKPKYVAYNLAIKCCKAKCPSWIWIQRTMVMEKCKVCSTPWWKSYHKNGVHLRQ